MSWRSNMSRALGFSTFMFMFMLQIKWPRSCIVIPWRFLLSPKRERLPCCVQTESDSSLYHNFVVCFWSEENLTAGFTERHFPVSEHHHGKLVWRWNMPVYQRFLLGLVFLFKTLIFFILVCECVCTLTYTNLPWSASALISPCNSVWPPGIIVTNEKWVEAGLTPRNWNQETSNRYSVCCSRSNVSVSVPD